MYEPRYILQFLFHFVDNDEVIQQLQGAERASVCFHCQYRHTHRRSKCICVPSLFPSIAGPAPDVMPPDP